MYIKLKCACCKSWLFFGLVIKTVAYRPRTDTGTYRKVKTERPNILSNDIFYFKTVMIGGPIQ